MLKGFFKAFLRSIAEYMKDIIVKSIIFKNGFFDGIYINSMIIFIITADIFVSKKQNQNALIAISAGLFIILLFMFVGYLLFLIFDFIPKNTIIKRVLPIRNKLNEIFVNSGIPEHEFVETEEIRNIDKLIKFERVPSYKVLEIWHYKLKQQRDLYLVITPLLYLLLYTGYYIFKSINEDWVNDIISYFTIKINFPSMLIELFKLAFVAFVVFKEAFEISVDMNRIELLKIMQEL